MKAKSVFGGVAAMLAIGVAASGVQADEAAVRAGMAKLLPTVELDGIAESPVPGLYEVTLGPRLFYMSEDGRYLIQGDVIDVESRKNLTEAKLAVAKKKALEQLDEKKMVIFAAEKPAHTITVFTDIDCGYCRKLHREMEGYNEAGINVRYLFYPRAGIGSPSFQKAVSVWCADDRKQAMTDAKSGKEIESKSCDNPVKEHLQLGQAMGVTGTPAIVLEDGEVLPGYIPAAKLAKFLDAEAAAGK
jgi:thiol:disulfide interchange protein DsbC